jgi:hypothetical protein
MIAGRSAVNKVLHFWYGYAIPTEATERCGMLIRMFCPQCGSSPGPDAQFCAACNRAPAAKRRTRAKIVAWVTAAVVVIGAPAVAALGTVAFPSPGNAAPTSAPQPSGAPGAVAASFANGSETAWSAGCTALLGTDGACDIIDAIGWNIAPLAVGESAIVGLLSAGLSYTMVGIDAASGAPLWTWKLAATEYPVCADKAIGTTFYCFFGPNTGTLVAIDGRTGETVGQAAGLFETNLGSHDKPYSSSGDFVRKQIVQIAGDHLLAINTGAQADGAGNIIVSALDPVSMTVRWTVGLEGGFFDQTAIAVYVNECGTDGEMCVPAEARGSMILLGFIGLLVDGETGRILYHSDCRLQFSVRNTLLARGCVFDGVLATTLGPAVMDHFEIDGTRWTVLDALPLAWISTADEASTISMITFGGVSTISEGYATINGETTNYIDKSALTAWSASGEPLWQTSIPGTGNTRALAYDSTHVIVLDDWADSTPAAKLYSLDPASGRILKELSVPRPDTRTLLGQSLQIQLLDDRAAVVEFISGGYSMLHGIDLQSLSVAWSMDGAQLVSGSTGQGGFFSDAFFTARQITAVGPRTNPGAGPITRILPSPAR